MSDYKLVPVESLNRAVVMLSVAGNHCEEHAMSAISHYDDADCDGICINDDCKTVIEMLAAYPPSGGEPTAWLHTVRDAKARDGDTDLALSFDDHSFPLDSIGWVSIKAQPLYNSPRVADVELAARRVITAFEAHGKTRGASETVKTHHECEAAMVALKAALGEGK